MWDIFRKFTKEYRKKTACGELSAQLCRSKRPHLLFPLWSDLDHYCHTVMVPFASVCWFELTLKWSCDPASAWLGYIEKVICQITSMVKTLYVYNNVAQELQIDVESY